MKFVSKSEKWWISLGGAVVFGVCLGTLASDKSCPPCPEARLVEIVDSLYVDGAFRSTADYQYLRREIESEDKP